MQPVTSVRVTYGDTDKMGVVYYANYLRFFEVGRAEWIRGRGRPYKEIEKDGVMLPVVEAHVRYRHPARYDDIIEIGVHPEEVRRASLKFRYELRRQEGDVLLAEGYTVHASVGPDGRPRKMPQDVLTMLGGGG